MLINREQKKDLNSIELGINIQANPHLDIITLINSKSDYYAFGLVGSGGFGYIYKCTSKFDDDNQTYALKYLNDAKKSRKILT